jgi:hypothetical protein
MQHTHAADRLQHVGLLRLAPARLQQALRRQVQGTCRGKGEIQFAQVSVPVGDERLF